MCEIQAGHPDCGFSSGWQAKRLPDKFEAKTYTQGALTAWSPVVCLVSSMARAARDERELRQEIACGYFRRFNFSITLL